MESNISEFLENECKNFQNPLETRLKYIGSMTQLSTGAIKNWFLDRKVENLLKDYSRTLHSNQIFNNLPFSQVSAVVETYLRRIHGCKGEVAYSAISEMMSASHLDERTVKKMIPTLRLIEGRSYNPFDDIKQILETEFEKNQTLNQSTCEKLVFATGMTEEQIKRFYARIKQERGRKQEPATKRPCHYRKMMINSRNKSNGRFVTQLKNIDILEEYFKGSTWLT